MSQERSLLLIGGPLTLARCNPPQVGYAELYEHGRLHVTVLHGPTRLPPGNVSCGSFTPAVAYRLLDMNYHTVPAESASSFTS